MPTPTRTLPPHPHFDQLKRQAKELLEAFRAGDATAIAEVAAHYRGAESMAFALHDAQLVLARARTDSTAGPNSRRSSMAPPGGAR